MPLPAWLALTVQVPAATSVSVLPLTVQTLGVVDVKDTVRPDVEVAASAAGAVRRVWLPGDANVIVCGVSGVAPTLKLRDSGVAAA